MPAADKKLPSSHVCTLTPEQIEQLHGLLQAKQWEFSPLPYAHWKARGPKVQVAAYLSGKVTIQGAGTADFVMYTLEPEILHCAGFGYHTDTQEMEETEILPHIGVDESGKGDFFGPLIIAGVAVNAETGKALQKLGVCDSKMIKSDRKICELANGIVKIVNNAFSVVILLPEKYNDLYSRIGNLNRLLAWGHARVIENILEAVPDCPRALSDKFGADHLIKNALMTRGRQIILEQETKAERDVAVAAASILARYNFIRQMEKLSNAHAGGKSLPRGATTVKPVALELLQQYGSDVLPKLVKTHFKTFHEIMNQSDDLLNFQK